MRLMTSYAMLMALGVAGCGDNRSTEDSPQGESLVAAAPSAATATRALPPAPEPNFVDQEDGTYYYVTAVSEEDRKKGKATGDVVGFRYLGLNDDGHHTVAQVGRDGSIISESSCAIPCKIIKYPDGERLAYSPRSIIGGVYQDAMNGLLTPKRAKPADRYPQTVGAIPKPFLGAWDEYIQDGCRSREARFYLTTDTLYNFEVVWGVSKVVMQSPDAIDIHTTTLDENGNQVSEVWQFALADNGKALTGRKGDSPYFRKCPNA